MICTSMTILHPENYTVMAATFEGILSLLEDSNEAVTKVRYIYSTVPVYLADNWIVEDVYLVTAAGAGDSVDGIPVFAKFNAKCEGVVPAYDTTGSSTDATMTQAAITNAISEANPYYKIDTTTASLHSTFRAGFTALFNSVLASAVAAVGTRVSSASSFSCGSVTNLLALCLGISPKVPQLIVTAASQTMILFLSSQYYNHYFFRAFIPYNDGTNDYNVDCMFMIDPAGMTIAMTAYAA